MSREHLAVFLSTSPQWVLRLTLATAPVVASQPFGSNQVFSYSCSVTQKPLFWPHHASLISSWGRAEVSAKFLTHDRHPGQGSRINHPGVRGGQLTPTVTGLTY